MNTPGLCKSEGWTFTLRLDEFDPRACETFESRAAAVVAGYRKASASGSQTLYVGELVRYAETGPKNYGWAYTLKHVRLGLLVPSAGESQLG